MCGACGGNLTAVLEEAVLDLEVRSARVPRAFLDVTVRHSVPGDASRLSAAAATPGAVNRGAEADKRSRYPDGRAPWRVIPFAVETYGRLGDSALKHLRGLARARAQGLPEGSDDTVASLLLQRWGARLSCALHRSNAARLRSALGTAELAKARTEELSAVLAS